MLEQKITETLEINYMPYAMSVIISRAIPEIDGFKPSHRKLLYTMYKMGLLTGAKTKSANVVGQTMRLNPHGDMAIYETLVRLTRGNSSLLLPFIDSKGNFGKSYSRDMAFAAPRYTEVKLDKICEEVFKDIDKNTVDFIDNYDSTMKEPVLLPVTFPNILVNPNQGIAVGMASNICGFNLKEACLVFIDYIKTKQFKNLIPDFPSGGFLLYNEKEIEQINKTGYGSFKLRAKYRYIPNCIEIYEIPYTTSCETIMSKITELVRDNKLKEISDIRDETDLKGLKITLDLKRGTDPEKLMSKLFKLTTLEDSFNCNFNILIDGMPKVTGVKEIFDNWLAFRIDCIKRKTNFEIKNKKDKLHLLKGLEQILLDIDKAIKIIKDTPEDAMVIKNLMDGFSIDKPQAEFVADMKLRNLNKEYIIKRTKEIINLEKEIITLGLLSESETKIKKLIAKELSDVAKQYGKERSSEILTVTSEEYSFEEEIDAYPVKIFLTEHGYIKKVPVSNLKNISEQRLKQDDEIIQEIETKNSYKLLLFSDKQNMYTLKIHTIQNHKAGTLGEYLSNILELSDQEKIIYIVATNKYGGFMIFGFENGKIAKITLSSYETNRKKITNAYNSQSPIKYITHIKEDSDLTLFSTINKVMVFNTGLISSKTTKDTQGVQVLRQKKKSTLAKIEEKPDLDDIEYYRVKTIPAIGYYIKRV